MIKELLMFRIGFFKLAACLSALCFFLASASLAAQPDRPGWVNAPNASHDRQAYVVAVGSGDSRRTAESDALRGLAGAFGLNVQAVEQITMLYREVVTDGAAAWTQQAVYRSAIDTSVRMDNLMGAEVAARWEDGRGTHFVLAVLRRATAVMLYSNRIRANQDVIRNLTNMTAAERNGIDAFARYQSAAALADMNFTYGEILVFLGAPWGEPLGRGEGFRQRGREIARSIPIGINVRGVNDVAEGRIRGAFAEVFLDEFGFLTGGANPRFVLDVDINMQPQARGGRPPIPGLNIDFSWIEILMDVRANLVDTGTGAVLLPYVFNFRGAGRNNLFDAENAAINEAAQRIRNEYGNRLSRLAPRR